MKIIRDGDKVIFDYNGTHYELTSHPYEPCLYIHKKDVRNFRTLHTAFDADPLPDIFAAGETVTSVTGKVHDEASFCQVLAATIDVDEQKYQKYPNGYDFPYAESRLVKK